MISRADIIGAVTAFAPPGLQESWDNSGVQVGRADLPCSGVLLCVDVTPDTVDEAAALGCDLIVSHHPLIFKGLRSITGATQVERAVIAALRAGITVYSAHTSLDSTRGGVSWEMARMIGAEVVGILSPSDKADATGLGVVARLDTPVEPKSLYSTVSRVFGSPHPRASRRTGAKVGTVALCGGSGGEFIPAAIRAGADAYITADIRYHDFVDYGNDIFLLDIGHFESESCAKDIFYRIITENFPNFAVYYSKQQNPIQYF